MNLQRFARAGVAFHGRVEDGKVFPVSLGAEGVVRELQPVALDEVDALPLVAPSKIVCIGVNYRVHASYGHVIPDEPLIFLKPPSAIVGHGEPIVLPATSRRVEFEGELAVVIGRRARAVTPAQAREYILGYCCANDVSARDIQEAEHNNFGRAKSFDTFAPVGPWLTTGIDPDHLGLETLINGQVAQSACTSDMVFSVAEIVAYVSGVMTLQPGDLILTGTPDGMGPLHAGDHVEVRIEGIGTLTNPVVDAAQEAAA